MDVLGFHRLEDELFDEDENLFEEAYFDSQNILNICGWFPFLGTVTGTIRLVGTAVIWITRDDTHKHKRYFLLSAFRGLVEIFSLGFLFVIPDLWATYKRKRENRKRSFKRRRKARGVGVHA